MRGALRDSLSLAANLHLCSPLVCSDRNILPRCNIPCFIFLAITTAPRCVLCLVAMDFTFMLFDFPEKREMEKLYRDRRQDVAQEMEGNEATSDLMA